METFDEYIASINNLISYFKDDQEKQEQLKKMKLSVENSRGKFIEAQKIENHQTDSEIESFAKSYLEKEYSEVEWLGSGCYAVMPRKYSRLLVFYSGGHRGLSLAIFEGGVRRN